jgi:hypothetical protein
MSIGSIGDGRRKRYANTAGVADYTGLSRAFFEKARVTGIPQIPFLKIGRAVRYDLDQIDQFMADRARISTSAGEANSDAE